MLGTVSLHVIAHPRFVLFLYIQVFKGLSQVTYIISAIKGFVLPPQTSTYDAPHERA
jgi:hypothetical protein